MLLANDTGGYAAQIELAIQRVEATLVHVGQIPLGGTAVGTEVGAEHDLEVQPVFADDLEHAHTVDGVFRAVRVCGCGLEPFLLALELGTASANFGAIVGHQVIWESDPASKIWLEELHGHA